MEKWCPLALYVTKDQRQDVTIPALAAVERNTKNAVDNQTGISRNFYSLFMIRVRFADPGYKISLSSTTRSEMRSLREVTTGEGSIRTQAPA